MNENEKFERIPIEVNFTKSPCHLCEFGVDCSGNTVLIPIYAPEYESFLEVEDKVLSYEKSGQRIRVITDIEPPKELVWASAYSEYNILQINLDISRFDNDYDWISQTAYLSNICGLYVVIFIYNVQSTVENLCRVAMLVHRLRNVVHFHINLKFDKNTVESGLCYKFVRSGLKLYTDYKNVLVQVCGMTLDCLGNGGRKSE